MQIVKYPHPALRNKAEPVTSLSKEIELLVGGMLELMYKNEGLGLAAPQVASPLRIFVMNFAADPEKKDHEFVAINPVIVEAGRIYAGGAKALGQDVIASGREGIEQASDAVKTLAEAKSPAEFFQIQSELARASFDRFVAETSKLTERVVKLTGEAVEPLQTRASLNAERINTLVA